jgi:signal transduction histidine kinase
LQKRTAFFILHGGKLDRQWLVSAPGQQQMRLAEFIQRDMNLILAAWDSFAAAQLPAAASMTPLALRDHAEEILRAVARDLETMQTRAALSTNLLAPPQGVADAPETAAQTHAVLRAQQGFSIQQLVAEFTALRASVSRLYLSAVNHNMIVLDDILRCNEIIDVAMAESTCFFSAQMEMSRNLFLGMIGHDLRNPLQAIQASSRYLSSLNVGEDIAGVARVLIRSGAAMRALLDDLADFNRTKLGMGLEVRLSDTCMRSLCEEEIAGLCAAHPQRHIELVVNGNTRGRLDPKRTRQLIGNLVSNALTHGAQDAPVKVSVHGEDGYVRVEVCNTGPVIDQAELAWVFEPLTLHQTRPRTGPDDGLGLGLFIVHAIVEAHGGTIEVRSDTTETVFSVRLPV